MSVLMISVCAVSGQIGGKTAVDGPFVLDDAEDLDLVADGVGRNWISDSVWPLGDVLSVQSLASSPELILAPGQSPVGALAVTIPSSSGFINAGFGVPMPGEVGVSTDISPGDITSFTTLSFNVRFDPVLSGQVFNVFLESNAASDPFPQVFWNYTPQPGNTFERVEIDLRSPGLILNAGSLTLEDLLSNTRFLFFAFFAEAPIFGTTLSVHIDDIRLESVVSSTENSYIYR